MNCIWCGWGDPPDHFDESESGAPFCSNNSSYIGDDGEGREHCEYLRASERRNGAIDGFARTYRGDKLLRKTDGVNALITPVKGGRFMLTVFGVKGKRLVKKYVDTADGAANVYHKNLKTILARNGN